MKWFYISYDLDKPGQNYQNLWNALSILGAHRVQDSLWLLRTNGTGSGLAKQTAERLRKHIDKNDRLVVIESADSSWFNLMINPNAA